MRIIHEIETPMQTWGNCDPYRNSLGSQGYNGARVEIMACTSAAANYPELPAQIFEWADDEAIYIEGNAKYVREMLATWIQIIDDLEEVHRARMGEHRSSNCPNCGPDDAQPNVTHLTECPQHVNHKLFHPDRAGGRQ